MKDNQKLRFVAPDVVVLVGTAGRDIVCHETFDDHEAWNEKALPTYGGEEPAVQTILNQMIASAFRRHKDLRLLTVTVTRGDTVIRSVWTATPDVDDPILKIEKGGHRKDPPAKKARTGRGTHGHTG
jgi:hypothetical protein